MSTSHSTFAVTPSSVNADGPAPGITREVVPLAILPEGDRLPALKALGCA